MESTYIASSLARLSASDPPNGAAWDLAFHCVALARNPDLLASHRGLAVIYSELGRLEEARAEVTEILRINPHHTLEGMRKSLPFKNQAELEHILDLLRKAGLK